MNKLTIEKLQEVSTKRNPEVMENCIVPKEHWDLFFSNALAGEVGEFCNLIKKVKRGSRKLDAKTRKEIRHELADCQTYLVQCAESLGINLADATVEKFNLVSKKWRSKIVL